VLLLLLPPPKQNGANCLDNVLHGRRGELHIKVIPLSLEPSLCFSNTKFLVIGTAFFVVLACTTERKGEEGKAARGAKG
jgi:hypothetical protein